MAASNITISKQLQEAPYVYVRRGGTIPPLAPVYSGPFGVLHAGPKVFTLEVDKRLCQWTGSSPTPVHYQSFQQFQPREVDPRNKSGLTVLFFITLLLCLFILVLTLVLGGTPVEARYILVY